MCGCVRAVVCGVARRGAVRCGGKDERRRVQILPISLPPPSTKGIFGSSLLFVAAAAGICAWLEKVS